VSLTITRVLAVAYFVAYAVAVTWPGMLPFSGVRLSLLGLPLPMVWVSLWIVGSGLVLWALDRVEARHRPGSRPPAGERDRPHRES
jgi:hypothetical protein